MNEKLKQFEKVISILGKPDFQADRVAIYNRDCLKSLNTLSMNCIDLTVTSPPYNIGKEYEKILPMSEYITWCINWMNEIYKVSNENASFWLNLGYIGIKDKGKAIPLSYLLWDKSPFYLIQEIVWNYSAGVAGKKFFSPRNEKFLWFVKNQNKYTFNLDDIRDSNVKYPNQKKNGKLKCNPLGKNPSDVWQISKITSGKNRSSKERTQHPAQFPSALIERIIKGSSNLDDIVLDPFIGSGTTAEVAVNNNRFVIGFEINPDYISIIKERLA